VQVWFVSLVPLIALIWWSSPGFVDI
jgi:hypothetical protein